jgi:transposase-like protein
MIWGTERCPDCGGRLKFTAQYEWCRSCRLKTSVKSETNFRNSNLSYHQIYALIWCWQKKKSVGTICDIVGVSYPTASKWLRKLRRLLPIDQTKLSGVVEIDESFFGRMRFTKHGGYKLVVGAVERYTRRVRLQIVAERNRETLEQFVLGNVESGSHINTDAWPAYNELNLLGFTHDFCNHSLRHFGETNHIENFWSVLKRHLRRLYGGQLTIHDLPSILNEWQIRQNQPELMYSVSNYLRYAGCSGLF